MTVQPLTFGAIVATGPSPGEDHVLEAACARAEGGQLRTVFAEVANPGERPAAARRLSGLSAQDVAGKPQPASVLRRLAGAATADGLVVYDSDRFTSFLVAEGVSPPRLIDARRLAQIALPTAGDYSLEGTARALQLPAEDVHRAAKRARLVENVWSALMNRLGALPPTALDAICRVAQVAADPLAPAIEERRAQAEDFELTSDLQSGLRNLFADHAGLLREAQKSEKNEPGQEPIPVDGICGMFRPDGPVGRALPGYEQREQQVHMARAVCRALNEGRHLMVEAGTGTGKSMAYLLPAIAWTCTNNDTVVVSTNTRNLQEQLYRKDLPFLAALLPDRFSAALLKGRRNYLCIRRFMHLMRYFERELATPQEFMSLAPLIAWAAETQTGDLAECSGFLHSSASASLSPMVTSGSDECAGRGCRFRTQCFVARARALAQLADLLVVNHALLFCELGLDTPVLPPYRCLVFDEAHNLEDVATEALATVVDSLGIYRITRVLYRARSDGSGSGLLATVMHETENELPEGLRRQTLSACGAAMEAVQHVVDAAKQFFDLLGEPFLERPPYVDRILMQECQPPVGPGSEAWQAAERLRASIRDLGEKIEETAQQLDGVSERLQPAAELAEDLRAQLERLREFAEATAFVLSQEDGDFVYWLERTSRERAAFHSAHAAPLQIGDYIREFFLRQKRTVVFTSATLEVDGAFDYTLERLGAATLPPGLIDCLSVGSPFDYRSQCMLGAATFLPDPGGRRDSAYDTELASFLAELLQRTRGRALVLFTSYSLLDAVYRAVRDPLARQGIVVLAQGHGGSREAITSIFRSDVSSVLLGTRSFWEGVDISGETLSLLVVTKLPFHVFTDPLVRGRTEYLRSLGRDPFLHYTLPEAVISFRQGSGRLIRRRDDTGVILCTDRRLVTKGYGRSFLNSMPMPHRVLRSRQEALDAVSEFLKAQGTRPSTLR